MTQHPYVQEISPSREPLKLSIDLDNLPCTIGRAPSCDYQVGWNVDGSEEAKLYSGSISGTHATIYRNDDGQIMVRDGNGKLSTNGLWVYGRKVDVEAELKPGREIVIAQRGEVYRAVISWPFEPTTAKEYDTLSNAQLVQEVLEKDVQISHKTGVVSVLETKVAGAEQQINEINSDRDKILKELANVRKQNTRQDRRIKKQGRVILAVAIAVGYVLVARYGFDTEQLEGFTKNVVELSKVVSILVSVFAIAKEGLGD